MLTVPDRTIPPDIERKFKASDQYSPIKFSSSISQCMFACLQQSEDKLEIMWKKTALPRSVFKLPWDGS